jgi:enamine deaminase RidA (YjgF/YER057c/UK114 family)
MSTALFFAAPAPTQYRRVPNFARNVQRPLLSKTVEQSLVAACCSMHALLFFSTTMPIYTRLDTLGIELPSIAAPAAAYVPFVKTGNLLFLSGHIARREGVPWVGQLGLSMDTAAGKNAARAVAIDLLGTLHAAVGDLNRVTRIVKVTSLVNSTTTFTEHHLVTNGCSELLGEIFGDKGTHARSAFGVAQLPMGACVEIELIAQVH